MRLLGFFLSLVLAAACGASRHQPSQALTGSDGGVASNADAGSPPAPSQTRAWPPERPGYVNPIAAENAREGTKRWDQFEHKSKANEIVGYADRVSARAGERVAVKVSSDSAHDATWRLYRLGWYGGAGAREVAHGGPFPVEPQPGCPPAKGTGLVRCAWATAFTLELAPQLVSGLYVVRLERDDHFGSWVPLVVTDDRPADLLFQASVTTYQAYNAWGGTSLYDDQTKTLPGGKAVQVSFDRPYLDDVGAGQMLKFDQHLARFLERYGYDVTYTTNVDVAAGGAAGLLRRGAFLSVGHDEYWPKAERDAAEQARDAGMPLLFFSANTAYWQIRLGEEAVRGNPRVITAYKERWSVDPVQGPEVTGRFRDPQLNRPENGLLGVMYDAWHHLRYPLTVEAPDSFLFQGTGLERGDAIPWMVGDESDRAWDNGRTPAGLQVLARTPVVDTEGWFSVGESTAYRAKSGALVFAGGTIEWVNGLGRLGPSDPRVERMTANVLHEALGLEVPADVGKGTLHDSRIEGPFAAHVSTVAAGVDGAAGVALLSDGAFAVVDTTHHRVLRVGADGAVSTIAGDGQPSNAWQPDGIAGSEARFLHPTAILALPSGDLLVSDTGQHCIRLIANDARHSVSIVAGDQGRDGAAEGAGRAARFTFPRGLALDPVTGDVLVADSWNHRIRAIDRTTWQTRTVAGGEEGDLDGPASTAPFAYPTAVAAAPDGAIYVLSTATFRVKRIDADPQHTVTTLAGGPPGANDGTGTSASFGAESGLVWSAGALYLSDTAGNRIRRIAPGSRASGTEVTTVAGSGRSGLVDGPGKDARLSMPLGLVVAPDGTLYVADAGNGAVRAITP